MSVYSYIRVSTLHHDQTTENQRKAILDAGFTVDEFFSENGVSGTIPALERPAFKEMMKVLCQGDTVICTMVDRLGRDAADILNTINEFKKLGVRVRVLQFDGVDVTSTTGKLIITVMAALAEMEKNLLIERTKSGLARTREQGTIFGRPLTIAPEILVKLCDKRNQNISLKKLSNEYDLDVMTIQRNTKKWDGKMVEYFELYNKQQTQIERNKVV